MRLRTCSSSPSPMSSGDDEADAMDFVVIVDVSEGFMSSVGGSTPFLDIFD